jgi:hypothetical protein
VVVEDVPDNKVKYANEAYDLLCTGKFFRSEKITADDVMNVIKVAVKQYDYYTELLSDKMAHESNTILWTYFIKDTIIYSFPFNLMRPSSEISSQNMLSHTLYMIHGIIVWVVMGLCRDPFISICRRILGIRQK